jgi:hypothetical protein
VAEARLIGEPAENTTDARIEVIDPGREPRQLLRYRFVPGQRQEVTQTVELDLALEKDGHSIYSPALPTTTIRAELQVLSSAGEKARVALRILDVSGIELTFRQRPPDFKRALNRVRGWRGEFEIDTRGRSPQLSSLAYDAVDDENAGILALNLEGLFEYLVILFPEPPLGVGARWQLTQEVVTQEAFRRDRFEFSLAERKGDHLKISCKQSVQFPPQRYDFLAYIRSTARLRGHGVINLRLDRVTPLHQEFVDQQHSDLVVLDGDSLANISDRNSGRTRVTAQ